jgi:Family of unknown function (DUF6515)/Bacterial SH3 domain
MHNKSKLTLRFFTIILATLFALTCFPATEETFAAKGDKKGNKKASRRFDKGGWRFGSTPGSQKKRAAVKRHDSQEIKVKKRDKQALKRPGKDKKVVASPPGSQKKRAAVKRHDGRKRMEVQRETKASRRYKKSGRIYRSRQAEHDRHYRRMHFNRHDHHRRIKHRGHNYYYQHGYFYRGGPYGYFLVNAPIGAVVWSLGFGFDTIWIGGSAYYHYGGTYYQRAPAGYVVVEQPVGAVAVREPNEGPTGSVYIEAYALNVRAQAGMNHPVIDQLHEGDIVTVYGTAPGWFYVELPNGYFGWIVRDCENMDAPYVCG